MTLEEKLKRANSPLFGTLYYHKELEHLLEQSDIYPDSNLSDLEALEKHICNLLHDLRMQGCTRKGKFYTGSIPEEVKRNQIEFLSMCLDLVRDFNREFDKVKHTRINKEVLKALLNNSDAWTQSGKLLKEYAEVLNG